MGAEPEQSGPQEQTPPEPPDAIREAVEHGIDISILRANLALAPAERLRRHGIALNTVETLREARSRSLLMVVRARSSGQHRMVAGEGLSDRLPTILTAICFDRRIRA